MRNCIKNKIIIEGKCEKCILLEDMKNFNHDRVWVTKKSRMNAEARMIKASKDSNNIINIYTFYTLIGSIGTLFWDNKFVNFFTIVVSVGLFGYTNYVNSNNYIEKGFRYRESYLKLGDLEDRISNFEKCYQKRNQENCKELFDKFTDLKKEYNHIMELYYNHEEIDYKYVKKDINNSTVKKFKRIYNFKYYTLMIGPVIIFLLGVLIKR